MMNTKKAIALALLTCVGATSASLQVIPGATWTVDNTGDHLQAHGAGIIQVSGTYYLIGEDKTHGSAFEHVNCYSSTDLVQWTFQNALLSVTSGGDLGPNRVVERPKVIYNAKTKTYVMYMHIDSSDYSEAKVGIATSASVCGNYSYRGSFRPLGQQSRDMGLFQDDDGSAYLLTEDRANGLRINRLSDDYLDVTASTFLWTESYEAPAVLKKNGYYFMFASHLSGWSPNDNVYSYAKSLSGPWSAWKTFAGTGTNTYASQTTFILPFGDSAIYLGDRWQYPNLMASTYVWLPLTISGTTVTMPNRASWVPSANSQSWLPSPAETRSEGETAVLSNGAIVLTCSSCSGGKAVGYIGGPSHGQAKFSNITSQASTRSTVRVNFQNGDSTPRHALISVNGISRSLAFLPTANGNTPGSSSLHCDLEAGGGNTIVIDTTDGTYGPDVDVL